MLGVSSIRSGQVARHVLVEVVAADHEVDLADLAGEVDGGLAGGVAAADDHDVRPAAHLRLDRSRGVVDAAALEPLAPLDAEQAIVGAGGDQQAPGRDRLAAVEVEHGMPLVERQAGDLRGDGQARAELVGLHDGALGQLGAGDAGGEAEVVLDAHAAAGLAPGRRSSTTVLRPSEAP